MGTVRVGESESPLDLRVEDDAVAGMVFVLAADLPTEEGYERRHADYNEARGFE